MDRQLSGGAGCRMALEATVGERGAEGENYKIGMRSHGLALYRNAWHLGIGRPGSLQVGGGRRGGCCYESGMRPPQRRSRAGRQFLPLSGWISMVWYQTAFSLCAVVSAGEPEDVTGLGTPETQGPKPTTRPGMADGICTVTTQRH
jgi:hypothetical protein